MNVTFRQLRLFLALAETGSVTAAARATHVSQPTASMQLKEIAGAVGLPLYEIVGRTLYLTDAGRELADTARAISQAWEAFEQRIDAAKGLARGKLHVAVVSTAKYFMPRLIGSFCARHPAIDVALEILNRDGVVQRLRENRDDLYIMSMPPRDMDLDDRVFMPNPIVVVAPTADPLLRRRHVPLEALAGRRFILREKGSGTRMAVDRHFRAHRFRPDVRLELGSNEAVKESVAGGLGVGVLSRHALHGHQKENGVGIVEVEGFPLASAWHVVHPAGKRLSPLAQAFKQHVLDEITD
ncbi:MAG: HTH-type transcriptional activator CmpR [Pseudomonadota bacterium]|jgi:DNA-binding transcriptional LysR family regulator